MPEKSREGSPRARRVTPAAFFPQHPSPSRRPVPSRRAGALCPRLALLTPRPAKPRGAAGAGPARDCGGLRGWRCTAEPPAAASPRPAPPPRYQPATGTGSGGNGATGMRRGPARAAEPGPRRRLLLLLLAAALAAPCCAATGDGGRRRAASLGEMLREVEALMEDTQHKLRNAVQEVRGRLGGVGCPPLPAPSTPGPGRTCGQRRAALTSHPPSSEPLPPPRLRGEERWRAAPAAGGDGGRLQRKRCPAAAGAARSRLRACRADRPASPRRPRPSLRAAESPCRRCPALCRAARQGGRWKAGLAV